MSGLPNTSKRKRDPSDLSEGDLMVPAKYQKLEHSLEKKIEEILELSIAIDGFIKGDYIRHNENVEERLNNLDALVGLIKNYTQELGPNLAGFAEGNHSHLLGHLTALGRALVNTITTESANTQRRILDLDGLKAEVATLQSTTGIVASAQALHAGIDSDVAQKVDNPGIAKLSEKVDGLCGDIRGIREALKRIELNSPKEQGTHDCGYEAASVLNLFKNISPSRYCSRQGSKAVPAHRQIAVSMRVSEFSYAPVGQQITANPRLGSQYEHGLTWFFSLFL